MTEFKIEKNVPLPPSKANVKSTLRQTLEAMEVGDSIFHPEWTPRRCTAAFSNLFGANPSRRFATRREGTGTRIWRVE